MAEIRTANLNMIGCIDCSWIGGVQEVVVANDANSHCPKCLGDVVPISDLREIRIEQKLDEIGNKLDKIIHSVGLK